MAKIPDLQSTNVLDNSDEIILRQDGIDKRIKLDLSDKLSWCKQNEKQYKGEYRSGVLLTEGDVLFYEGVAWEAVSAPYTTLDGVPTGSNDTGSVNKSNSILSAGNLKVSVDSLYYQNTQLVKNLGPWQPGLVFENKADYATYNNQAFVLKEDTTLPYTTQGSAPTVAPDAGNVVPFADVTRSDVVLNVASISELLSVQPTGDGSKVDVTAYHDVWVAADDAPKGGGVFVWDSSRPKSDHNGGTVIDPDALFPAVWSDISQQTAWFESSNRDTGCWIRPSIGFVSAYEFGTVGDGVVDDTLPIQSALYCEGNGNPNAGELYPEKLDVEVFLQAGVFRITKPIHQPSGVQVRGSGKPMSNIMKGLDSNNVGTCLIYADFEENLQSSWLITGYARNNHGGLSNDDVIDPFLLSAHPDDGATTRVARSRLVDVLFFTDKNVASAVSFCAAYDVRISIGTYGFLHPVVGRYTWTAEVDIYSLSALSGGFFYDVRGLKLKGYSNGFSDKSEYPPLDASTAPAGWQTTVSTGYSPYETTGIYSSYCAGLSATSFVSEGWHRGRVYWGCEGVSESSPYSERIDDSVIVNINSSVTVTSPQYYAIGNAISSGGGGSASTKIINPCPGEKITGVVQNSASVRVQVECASPDFVHSEEKYSSNVDYTFYDNSPIAVYVDGSQGVDTNTGLNPSNSVKDLSVAISRAHRYKADIIYVAENTSCTNTQSADLESSNIRVIGEGAGATFDVYSSNGTLRRIDLVNSGISFENMDIVVPPNLTSSSEAMVRPVEGSCGLSLKDCNVTVDSSSAIFNSAENKSALLTFDASGTTITAENWGLNGYASRGSVLVLPIISVDCTINGAAGWESNFKVVATQ